MLKTFSLSLFAIMVLISFPVSSFSADAADKPKAAASTEDKEAKLNDIRKLMELTGGGDVGTQVVHQMFETFKRTNPDIPATFWDEFAKEVDGKQLVELNVPIYDQHLSHEEIKGIIKFYESPIGKRFIEVLPAIVQESYAAGQQWGYGIGVKLRQRLEEKGYLKAAPASTEAGP